jgi:hypothetical protein
MTRIVLVVAALLLTNLMGVAAAADHPEQKSKKSDHARNTLIVLGHMGLDTKEISEFVTYVDERVEGGRFRIAEERIMGGKLSLSIKLNSSGDTPRGPELRFTPDDSDWDCTANLKGVMVNYKITF